MTISEAVFLVLNSMMISQKEENNLFVLDMGEPVKILDLAESLIRFFGYEPYNDIKIDFI
jgi:FlaA1/EpsC-like NDP-sugar epimerase